MFGVLLHVAAVVSLRLGFGGVSNPRELQEARSTAVSIS